MIDDFNGIYYGIPTPLSYDYQSAMFAAYYEYKQHLLGPEVLVFPYDEWSSTEMRVVPDSWFADYIATYLGL